MQLTRRKLTIICLITILFVLSACVNSYAVQLSFLDNLPDTDKTVSAEGFGASAMCVPPDTDSSERNEKLTSSNELYIRFNKTESMIFCNCISSADFSGAECCRDRSINTKEGESLTGQVVMRC